MTIPLPVRLPQNRLPIARRSGAVARILPVLTASLALAAGADSARASAPTVPAASDTLRITLSAPEGGTVAEGETGHFEVSVEGSTAAGSVTVRYSISGTAVAGEDYTALSGEATVAQGENVARIALQAFEDGILDKGETVVLALTGATAPGTLIVVEHVATTATIVDKGSVTVSLTAVPDTVSEGSAWSSTVTMSMPVADRVSVRWWTNDGTAVAGRDYTAANETVLFEPGETSKPISVQTLKDDNTEAVEVFYVSLDPPSISTSAATAGWVAANADARSAFIECSVRFPQRSPIVFELMHPVKSGQVIGTVAAETTDGIPYYVLDDGGENKFTINALTAQISTTAALDPGLYELEVTVHDECGAQASVDVTVVVKQPNRAPKPEGSIRDTMLVAGESAMVDVSSYFSDLDEDRLTYTVGSSDATVVEVSIDGSKVTYKGLKAGSATVTVTADDGRGGTAQQKFVVTVKKGNEAPKVEQPIDDLTLYVGDGPNEKEIEISDVFKDPDGDDLGYEVESSNTAVATATLTGSTLTVTATGKGTATVTVTATDPGDLTAQDVFAVEVPNRAPVVKTEIDDLTLYVGEGTNRQRIDLSEVFRDPDGDVLGYEAVSSNTAVATATVSGNTLTVTSKGKGKATVTVTARDPGGLEAVDEFTVEVPNRTPVVKDDIDDMTLYVGEGTTQKVIDLTKVFSDSDEDVLGYEAASSNTAVATATLSGSTLTVTATGKGNATVTVTATDGDLEAVDKFDVEVPNRVPVVANSIEDLTLYVGEGTNEKEIEISGVFRDPDGDDLGHAVESSDTDVATVVLRGTTLTVTATGKGRANVSLTANDGMGGTKKHVFEVRVPNRKPTLRGTISDRAVDVGRSRSVDVTGYFHDRDGDDLTYTSVSSDTDEVTVNASGSPVRFTGVAEGSATVTVTAKDTGGLTATQQFDVEVYERTPDCKINVSAAALSVLENAGVGTALSSDVSVDASDCGRLRYALSGAGWEDFSVAAAGASNDDARIKVAKTPNHEARAAYALKLTVSWGSVSGSADVDITVTDVNEAPKATGSIGRQTIRVGRPGSVNVTNYFTDEDAGDRLTFTSQSSATGKLTVNASGSPVTLTGVAAGSATVTVTARDRAGLTATQTFPVTIEPEPEPCGITVSNGALSVPENARVGDGVDGKVGVTTTGDCGTLSYGLSGTGSGDFSVAAASASDDDGKIKVKRALNHEGRDAYDLTLTVSEVGGTATGAGNVDISVTDVNEPPKPYRTIATQTVRVGRPGSVDVTGYFTDEDAGDRLTFESKSSATGRLTVNASGSPVTLTGGGALDSYTRLSANGRTRSWSFGTRYHVSQTLRLGVEGSRSRMPGQDSNTGLGLALDFTF